MKKEDYLALMMGADTYIIINKNGKMEKNNVSKAIILSGSFHPLHKGHKELLITAEKMTKLKPFFEISIQNVDKENIPIDEMNARISQFKGIGDILVTNLPTFVEKSSVFQNSIFVIGFDTAKRILDDKYYIGSKNDALEEIRELGCSFLVAGRKVDKNFRTKKNLILNKRYKEMFMEISENRFRIDISSTLLRKYYPTNSKEF
jgi:nicotinic acid mononucleotide adenylyltransferase